MGVRAKLANLYPLLLLNIPIFPLRPERTVYRIINVYIRPRPRIRRLGLFIALSVVTAVEGRVPHFFGHYFVLNVIFLLLVVVLARSWHFSKGLLCVWRLYFMLPKVTSFRFDQE